MRCDLTIIGCYRIYPSWFADDNGGRTPMNELAYSSARQMGREVLRIRIVDRGTDFRGQYIDFNVTYSSSTQLVEKRS